MTVKEQIERWASRAGISALDLAKMTVADFANRVDGENARRDSERRAATHCSCVRMNSAIGIHDLGQQARANRYGMGFGLVSNTYSADKSCTKCNGTGRKS